MPALRHKRALTKQAFLKKKNAGNGELGIFLKKKNTALRGINIRLTLSKMADGVLFLLRFS